MGLVAQQQAASILSEPEALRTDRFQRLFDQVEKGGSISVQAVLEPAGGTLIQRGTLPLGSTSVKVDEGCTEAFLEASLVVSCALPRAART